MRSAKAERHRESERAEREKDKKKIAKLTEDKKTLIAQRKELLKQLKRYALLRCGFHFLENVSFHILWDSFCLFQPVSLIIRSPFRAFATPNSRLCCQANTTIATTAAANNHTGHMRRR